MLAICLEYLNVDDVPMADGRVTDGARISGMVRTCGGKRITADRLYARRHVELSPRLADEKMTVQALYNESVQITIPQWPRPVDVVDH